MVTPTHTKGSTEAPESDWCDRVAPAQRQSFLAFAVPIACVPGIDALKQMPNMKSRIL